MKTKIKIMTLMSIIAIVLAGCGNSSSLKDGYYTAQMEGFSHGWQEYLIIQVKSGKIVSAEYNAKNASGFIKAWDNSYMKNMMDKQETYPNKYTREYVQQLIDGQADMQVDIVTGASNSGGEFVKLVDAVLKQAASGDTTTAIVK